MHTRRLTAPAEWQRQAWAGTDALASRYLLSFSTASAQKLAGGAIGQNNGHLDRRIAGDDERRSGELAAARRLDGDDEHSRRVDDAGASLVDNVLETNRRLESFWSRLVTVERQGGGKAEHEPLAE